MVRVKSTSCELRSVKTGHALAMTILLPAPEGHDTAEPQVSRPWVRVGALAMVLAALTLYGGYWASHRPPVYWSRVTMLFLPPTSAVTPNALLAGSDSLITTAGVVGRIVGGSGSSNGVVSDSVTLPSEGTRHGWTIRLPDTGGQWATNFSDPALDVQAVAGDPAAVTAMVEDVERRVQETLTQLQDDAGVDPVNRISVTANPTRPPIYAVGGSHTRALASTLLLGTVVSTVLVVAYARWLTWRTAARFAAQPRS